MDRKRLQLADQHMLERYGMWATHMLTLTLADSRRGGHVIQDGWAKGGVVTYEQNLTEEAARGAVRYFVKSFNDKCYGRKSKKERTRSYSRIVAIPVIEGLRGNKRTHAHILLGNIPKHIEPVLEKTINQVWSKAKWGMQRMKLDTLHDVDGVAHYLAKEVGFVNDGAVCWEYASIPGRLLGEWS